MSRVSKAEAEALLRECIGPDAAFRPQQWEAIDGLVNEQKRLFIVQRTGWGKSTVYFITTRFLRDRGAGPTLLISPLLSLMNNQIQDAETQLGLTAVTINSNNTDEWESAKERVLSDECDLLVISPERLSNPSFRADILDEMLAEFGMLVVDEAHCISDWGHDFRPDYRRIKRLVERLPKGVPVAATTATANDRVVDDVTDQLPGLETIRGTLVRDSLRIQAIDLGSKINRLAWLAENFPLSEQSGIIYCLTTKDVENVTEWMQSRGHAVEAYHGRLDADRRAALEGQLLDNDVDALAATNALGMGFNKPDLGFVIHFQRPPNIIRYYQEIGRAGRDLEKAYAILLAGESDDDVAEYFIESAFPDPTDFQRVLEAIESSEEPLYRYEILKRIDVASGTVGTCLDILQLNGAISRVDDGFVLGDTEWRYEAERITRVTEQRRRELRRIQEFVTTGECLTRFIDTALDGNQNENCGFCANCAGDFVPRTVSDETLLGAATEFYRHDGYRPINPRKRLPEKRGTYEQIDASRQLQPGYALCALDEPGWGDVVRDGLTDNSVFDERLVAAATELIGTTWSPEPLPTWVTYIPNAESTDRLRDFAKGVAESLDIQFTDVVEQTTETEPQATLQNSYQQCWNVRDAFDVTDPVNNGPVLLIDDVVGSRWTLTEVGMRLRDAGSGPVYPFALADRRGG